MEKRVKDVVLTEGNINKYRVESEEEKMLNNTINKIEEKIFENREKDLEIIRYMITTYKQTKEKGSMYEVKGDMKRLWDALENKDQDILRYFSIIQRNEKVEAIDWCRKSQEILFNEKKFTIFNVKKESLDITRYGFIKTKEIIDDVKKSKENVIQNIVFLDYVLGISLTDSVYLCTNGISDKKKLSKIFNVIDLLNQIPGLYIRNSIVEDIIRYVSKTNPITFNYLGQSTNFIEWKIQDFDEKRIEKIEIVLKKIIEDLQTFFTIQKEILEGNSEDENQNLKNMDLYEEYLDDIQWRTFVDFLNPEKYKTLKVLKKQVRKIGDEELVEKLAKLDIDINWFPIPKKLYRKDLQKERENIEQKEKVVSEEIEIAIKRDKTENFPVRIKVVSNKLNNLQRYAFIHKQVVKSVLENL